MLRRMRGNDIGQRRHGRRSIFEISCFVGGDPTPRCAYALATSRGEVEEAIRNTGDDPDDYEIRKVNYWPMARAIELVRNGHFVEEEEE